MAKLKNEPERDPLFLGLKKAMAGSSRVDIEGYMNEMIEAFGGAKALALETKKTYDLCNSPMIKQRLLMMIQQLIYASTHLGLTKQRNPSDLSDDDLMDVAAELSQRMLNGRLEGEAEGTVRRSPDEAEAERP